MANFNVLSAARQGLLALDLSGDVDKDRRASELASACFVADDENPGTGAMKAKRVVEPGNAALWKHDPDRQAPRGAWGSWSFAYPARLDPGEGEGDEDSGGVPPGELRPLETADATDADFLGLREGESAPEGFAWLRETYGGELPRRTDAVVTATTSHGDERVLVAAPVGGPIVADQRHGGRYSRHAYDVDADGSLAEHARLDTLLWVDEAERCVAINMLTDAYGPVYGKPATSGGSVVPQGPGEKKKGVLGYLDWRRLGPLHMGAGAADKHGSDPGPVHLNPPCPWFMDQERDGPLDFRGAEYPNCQVMPIPTEVYLDWDEDAQRFRWWTTSPFFEPQGPPPPGDGPPRIPIDRPNDKVPVVPGNGDTGDPETGIPEQLLPFVRPSDKLPPWWQEEPLPDGTEVADGVPLRALTSRFEISAPSFIGLAVAPATAGPDGRYGIRPADNPAADGRDAARFEVLDELRGGPPPQGTHLVCLGRYVAGEGWDYTTAPETAEVGGNAALWSHGTADSVLWVGPPEVTPDGLWDDPAAAQVSESGLMLYGGDGSRPASRLWLGGDWSADAGVPRSSAYLLPDGGDACVGFTDSGGDARAGTLKPVTDGSALGTAGAAWVLAMRFAHVRGGSGATITVEHEHTVNAQAGVVRLPDAPGDGYPIQIHNRDSSSNTSVRASAYPGYGGSDYINVNSAGGEEFTIAPNDGVTLFYDATDAIWYAAGEYDHT